MEEITAEQLRSVLNIVSNLDEVDLTQELDGLESTYAGYHTDEKGNIDRKMYWEKPENETAVRKSATRDKIDKSKESAEKKTQLGSVDFLMALLKTNPYLASLLFVLVIIAGIATAVPAFPTISAILVWLLVVVVLGIILAALRTFLKGKVLSKVSAFCLAMKYAKGYSALQQPPPKLRRTCWDLWLGCGSEKKEFLVAFNGSVAPVVNV